MSRKERNTEKTDGQGADDGRAGARPHGLGLIGRGRRGGEPAAPRGRGLSGLRRQASAPRRAGLPGQRSVVRVSRLAGRLLSRYWTVLALVGAWSLWIEIEDVNQIVAPTPAAVFGDVLGHPGAYLPDLGWTLLNAAVGLLAGMLLGAAVAVAVWFSPLLSGLMTPVALIMRSVPVVAMIPVIARVVGFGDPSVFSVTILVSFFPAFVMTGSGLRSAPAAAGDVFTVLNASRLTRLRRLLLPYAVPGLLVALRLTAATAVLGAMLAEYLIGTRGLGRLFADSTSFMEPERAWGTALVATVVSATSFVAARALERWGTTRFA